MRRSYWAPLLLVVVMGVGGMIAVLAARVTPILGLDLRGGASVVLQPTRSVPTDTINEAINIIRNRVDALGVAEPDISRQGNSIVVELPGVKDTQKALQVVGQTAQLTFRPVLQTLAPSGPPATTPAAQVKNDAAVVLPERDTNGNIVGRYELAPVVLTGTIIKTAVAGLNQSTSQWEVDFTTTGPGASQFDQMAQKNYQKQVAIVLDNNVESAPTIQSTSFGGRGVINGSFTQDSANSLALVLRFGALPVPLKPLTVQTVSATLGKTSLKAGLLAAAGGLLLVLLYVMFYYRALGIVAFLGLALTGMLLWPIISLLGKTNGLALTLSGVIGIIVSIGITVDSYVVYFERLKDEIRSGKTVRSSVDRGFARAFRTIVAADLVSLIAAVLLWLLSVGAVRGFAFFLGLSTILDLFTSWFFTRPIVILLGRSRTFTDAPVLGVARGLAASGTP